MRRYELFVTLCQVEPHETILDVGAGSGAALARFNQTNPIVALDIAPVPSAYLAQANVTVEIGDATALPFRDRAFPLVFSNSVVEHLPESLRPAFASEIRRVSERYFVQTPNRYFPIEPHYQFPLFQFLPEGLQRYLNHHITLGWQGKGKWEDIHLLSARELQRLFPDAQLYRERLFGMTKSLLAVRQ